MQDRTLRGQSPRCSCTAQGFLVIFTFIYFFLTNILPVIRMKRQGSFTAVKKAMAQPSPLPRPWRDLQASGG